jgi:RimJ/RimL family protein N-acetyltransferase
MLADLLQMPFSRWLTPGGPGKSKAPVLVKQLGERDRRRILKHFIALDDSDRLLRFGNVLSDEAVEKYVRNISFSNDTVYGVVNRLFRLVAVGHLAFGPKEKMKDKLTTDKERVAEFGISVSASARGLGIGSKMFERAAIHCRNSDVDALYIHCLSSNQVMMHIAKKAGMEIQRDRGEADAWLRLPPPSSASVMQEAIEEQVATIDYTIKANRRAALKWFAPRQ